WLRLFANCAQQQYYEPTQGEAKRMEIWFNFFPGEFSADAMDRFNSLVQRPPRLFSARWVRTSGGLGLAPEDPEHTLPDLYKALTRGAPWNPAIVARDGTTGYGLRNWGDRFFLTQCDRGGYRTAWSNNYYDSIFKSSPANVLAGDPTRFDEAQVLANHYMDIDICHYRFQQPDQAGADYILSFDHTGTLSRPTGRPFVQGLVTMGLLAADPDYLETASLMADRVVALTKETGGKIGMRCDH